MTNSADLPPLQRRAVTEASEIMERANRGELSEAEAKAQLDEVMHRLERESTAAVKADVAHEGSKANIKKSTLGLLIVVCIVIAVWLSRQAAG